MLARLMEVKQRVECDYGGRERISNESVRGSWDGESHRREAAILGVNMKC